MAQDATALIKVDPAGSSVYDNVAWDAKGISKITKIYISYGQDHYCNRITSLQFNYTQDGNTKFSPVYGFHTGSNFETIELCNLEHIIGLSGTILNYKDNRNVYRKRVTSLTFETNLKKYGPFGATSQGDWAFNFRFGPGNHFGGLYGTYSNGSCGVSFSSIGVYVRLH